MWIFELIDKIKTEQEKFSGSICLPVQIKEKQNALLLDALKCAKEKNLLFLCDENQNTLLHKFCEIPRPDAECLKFILKNAPNLANFQNNEGKLPSDILLEIEKKTLLSNRPIKVLLLECMQPGEKRTALDLSANMSLLERIDDTNPKINYCEYITSNYSSLLKRPTLLCFSGRYTFMPKEANGFAKIIRDSLDILHTPTPKIQTLAAWYPGHTLDLGCDLFAFLSPYVKADDDSPFFYVQRFVERYFKPLYTDKNGRPLDIEEASKNMRMINMIGYSYGGSIIQMISNQLTEDMKKVGYKIKEIKKIQSQICVFTIGYFANPNNYKNDFSSYHLVQKKDEASYDTLKNIIDKKQTDGRSFYISTLKKQPHQKIYVADSFDFEMTQNPHGIKNYLQTEDINQTHTIANLWRYSVLINALNNSIENFESESFIPLPSRLEDIPSKALFIENTGFTSQLQKLSEEVGYTQQRINAEKRVIYKHQSTLRIPDEQKIRNT